MYNRYSLLKKQIKVILFTCCLSFSFSITFAQAIYRNGELILNPSSVPEAAAVRNSTTGIKEKYARYLHVSPDSLVNVKLYAFIDRWMHTPYKWGGTGKNGIDCSAFIQRLLDEVYDLRIPRTSIQQLLAKSVEPYKSPKYLSEGDIIFSF